MQGGKVQSPTLHRFLIEAALYKYVGLNLDDLAGRPLDEAQDYLTIIQLYESERGRQAAQAAAESARRSRGMG